LEFVVNSANERKDDTESFGGARKLIRPLLSAVARRRNPIQAGDPLTHALVSETHGVPASSHAEAFYFQKQIQQQTEMTVVLEDGEELHGTVEWYDRCSIKLRSGRHRTLIFKSAIKYLYKTSDAQTAGTVMR
jgi:host factor-I protein